MGVNLLKELHSLPAGLLDCAATDLHQCLGGPTLIHLEGRRQAPLFVSVLMHGNETTGWDAARELLRQYRTKDQPLPRSLSLFIANTAAAEKGARHLEGQPDFNRIWPVMDLSVQPNENLAPVGGLSQDHQLMQLVVDKMEARGVFASVDIHNNTGLNPHYACINRIEIRTLHLAALFGHTIVYFLRPLGVASMAMSRLCPSVTLECGRSGQRHGIDHARDYLDACLHLSNHPEHRIATHDLDLFHTMATVKISKDVDFGITDQSKQLSFIRSLDRLNFCELPIGTKLADVSGNALSVLEARDDDGMDVTSRYFKLVDGELMTNSLLMPSMLTQDLEIIREDCLCYIMERYDHYLKQA